MAVRRSQNRFLNHEWYIVMIEQPLQEIVYPISFPRSTLIERLKRWNPEIESLEFLSVQPTVWNDGSLGCPMPGKCYTQALVHGYLIFIRSGHQILEIHTNGSFSSLALPGVGFI